MPPCPPRVVEAVDLSYRFGAHWAVRHASLTLRAGETLLLSGANGAGKSTLLRLLATALRPSWGSLRLFGGDAAAPTAALRRQVAMLGQMHGMYENLSAAENLTVVSALTRPAARPQVATLLAELQLGDAGSRPLHAFSAGMRRRLALARLCLLEAPLLLLDEPLAQLDAAGCAWVVARCDAWRRAGRTLVLCSHELPPLLPLCDTHLRLSASGLQPVASA